MNRLYLSNKLVFTVCVLYSFSKNFTLLIPGTSVEILDQDSKNVLQLIISAYNVSKPLFD